MASDVLLERPRLDINVGRCDNGDDDDDKDDEAGETPGMVRGDAYGGGGGGGGDGGVVGIQSGVSRLLERDRWIRCLACWANCVNRRFLGVRGGLFLKSCCLGGQ